MTMPEERTRALRFAGELMRELMLAEDVPERFKHQARVVLRHYPSEREIEEMRRDEEQDAIAREKHSPGENALRGRWLG